MILMPLQRSCNLDAAVGFSRAASATDVDAAAGERAEMLRTQLCKCSLKSTDDDCLVCLSPRGLFLRLAWPFYKFLSVAGLVTAAARWPENSGCVKRSTIALSASQSVAQDDSGLYDVSDSDS